jgi:hypothetical protein
MQKVRVGQNSELYFVGFEPPLEPDQLEALPNPYKREEGAEVAGWPRTSIISDHHAAEMVVGVFKKTLILNAVSRKPTCVEVDFESIPADALNKFLAQVSIKLYGAELDPVLYDVETEAGVLNFTNAGNSLFGHHQPDCA